MECQLQGIMECYVGDKNIWNENERQVIIFVNESDRPVADPEIYLKGTPTVYKLTACSSHMLH